MGRRQTETLVGTFVLLGMLAILFLALKAANLASFSFESHYPLLARFDNVGGLKVHAPVKSAGVTVGKVSSIAFDGSDYRAVVTMQIDDRFRFPADSDAKILTAGLLGDQYIGLDAGSDDRKLNAGETIAMAQSAIVLENLIGALVNSKAAEPAARPGAK